MRSSALAPGELVRLTTDGIAEMRGLLTPDECEALAPPSDVVWDAEEPENPTRSWAHTPEYLFGSQAEAANPNLQTFLKNFRDLVQSHAVDDGVAELTKWGNAPLGKYPIELFGLQRLAYGAKWHRTLASHEIGWHSDNTYDLADKTKGEIGLRALGLMVAINLTKHGGAYEYAPATAETNPDGSPSDLADIKCIEQIEQGDAIGFCTARDSLGEHWPGSFPLHRFVSDEHQPDSSVDVVRDSLVIFFRDVSDRTFADIGLSGVIQGVRARLVRR